MEGISCGNGGLTASVLETVINLGETGGFFHPVNPLHEDNVGQGLLTILFSR